MYFSGKVMKNVRDAGLSRKRGGNAESGAPLPGPVHSVSLPAVPVMERVKTHFSLSPTAVSFITTLMLVIAISLSVSRVLKVTLPSVHLFPFRYVSLCLSCRSCVQLFSVCHVHLICSVQGSIAQ